MYGWVNVNDNAAYIYFENDEGFIETVNIDESIERPWICISSTSDAGSAFDMALLPQNNIGSNELVCIEYKYYMAICVLLMIAFASFLCFIVVALNKLKQLRERSFLY